jgi:hypothetical protein
MMYVGDFLSQATVYIYFTTHKADGTPITLAGTPVISVYKDNVTTETTTGPTLTVDFDSRTGLHCIAIATTDAFYATGHDYKVVITTGTVDSVSVVGYLVGSFSIENRFINAASKTGFALAADQAVNVTKWNGHTALEVVNGSPVCTLGATQAAYAPAKAGDAMLVSVGTGAGQVNVASGKVPATVAAGDLATDSLTADALKADAVTEIIHGLLDHAASGHLTAGSVGALLNTLIGKMVVTGNQLVVYAADNTTVIATYNLFAADGSTPTMTDVYYRVKV